MTALSKTDKTKPWRVRATERPMVTCVPVHRHHLGNCDLPEPLDGFERPDAFRCYWTATTSLLRVATAAVDVACAPTIGSGAGIVAGNVTMRGLQRTTL